MEKYAPDTIIVKFKDNISKKHIKELNKLYNTVLINDIPQLNVMILNIPKNKSVEEMINIYKDNDAVEYVEPDYYVDID